MPLLLLLRRRVFSPAVAVMSDSCAGGEERTPSHFVLCPVMTEGLPQFVPLHKIRRFYSVAVSSSVFAALFIADSCVDVRGDVGKRMGN